MTKEYYLKEAYAAGAASRDSEIEALRDANLELERLCDATYVAQGADAYHHACECLEAYQDVRRTKGKEVGTTGSLCDGMEWVYARLDETEANIEALRADAARYRWLRSTTNYVTNSKGERLDIRNQPEEWDAAIDNAMKELGANRGL
jgi:hypothetical protein